MSNSGERQVKGPEKSNFALTCNLLSQFIKEKGIVVKPGLTHQAASVSATVGLLTNIPPTKQQDCFINLVDDDDDDSKNKASTSKETTKTERKAAQLTIFYEGKVLVFDDYPTDKARDLVSMAKKGSSKMSYGILANKFGEKGMIHDAKASSTSSPREGLPPRPHTCCSSNKHVNVSPNTCKDPKPRSSTTEPMDTGSRSKEPASSSSDENASDLPIARRSSIYRFLEKRKDRAATRGPYHVQEQATASASASTSTCDERFDLNL